MKLFENCSSQRVFGVGDFSDLVFKVSDITSNRDDSGITQSTRLKIILTTETDKLIPLSAYDMIATKILAKLHENRRTVMSVGRSNGKTAFVNMLMNNDIKDRFAIKRVIFNDPATIVLWEDGSKTVVKSQENDIYDPEKGMAMAIAKRALGDEGSYYNEFKKWVPCEEENDMHTLQIGAELYHKIVTHFLNNAQETINNLESDAE